MHPNVIAALLGLLFSLALAAYLIWETAEGLRKGRFFMRGPTTITRSKHPTQYYFSLAYKLVLIGLSVAVAIYASGRLVGLWGPI
jgi:hypothetical protein